MSIDIIPVQSKQDFKDFVSLPWSIYRDFPCWVPPLICEFQDQFDPKKNPFLTNADIRLFLAKKDGIPAGRVVAIDNHKYRDYYKEPLGFFGHFESIRDHEVAKRLFAETNHWLRQRGLTSMRGPVGLAPFIEDVGLLYKGFDESPTFMMPYNPEYYIDLLEGVGFKKTKDNFTYEVQESNFSGKIQNLLNWVGALNKQKTTMTIRKINMKDFDNEVGFIRENYHSIFGSIWGFVPITDAEFLHLANQLKKIIDPDLVLMAEVDNQLVGFIIGLPDMNQVLRKINGRLHPLALLKVLWGQRKINGLRLLVGGVKEEHRNAGTSARLLYELTQVAIKKGFTKTEFSWVVEDNKTMHFILGKVGLKIRKTYRLYEQTLANS